MTATVASKQVLVIEDIRDSLAGTIAELEDEGVSVDHVGTVEEALEKVNEQKYDVILLDWRLPMQSGKPVDDEAGAVFLEQLKSGAAGKKNRKTPVLVITAQWSVVDPEAVQKFPNCRGVVSKLRIDHIAEEIDHIIEGV